jgi:cytosine/adenosine deaminase-related metal-dependent hydrolase
METTPTLNRRELLTGATLVAAGTLLADGTKAAALPAGGTVVFTHTTVVNADQVRNDVALAVQGNRIVAIGPTQEIVPRFPGAELYDGRGKALLPGLVNCHTHLAQTLGRGWNEDYGFPNSSRLPVRLASLLTPEENTLMAVVGAIEGIRCGATSIVQIAGDIAVSADALAATGARMVFAESIRDRDSGNGPMTVEQLARGEPPRFSAKLREQGMQKVADLHSKWHGKDDGRISVFPAPSLAEDVSPELLHAVRDFAEKHDLNYTIHVAQSRWENEYMQRWHGMHPVAYLDRHGALGPRLFAAHCRYVGQDEVVLLGRSRTMVSHQAAMAANRGADTPIPALREAGATIVLGTDNNTTDIFEAMRTSMRTERIKRATDAVPGLRPQPEDVLRDATEGGAQAINQAASLGKLEVGRKADLLVLDARKVHLVPALRILSAWVHNGQPSDIESSMVDGRFVLKKGKILTLDEATLVADADRIGKRVWKKVMEGGRVEIPGHPGLGCCDLGGV